MLPTEVLGAQAGCKLGWLTGVQKQVSAAVREPHRAGGHYMALNSKEANILGS